MVKPQAGTLAATHASRMPPGEVPGDGSICGARQASYRDRNLSVPHRLQDVAYPQVRRTSVKIRANF